MKIVKICGDVWKNASRDKRELSVYREMGAEVSVVAKGWGRDRLRGDMIDGYRVLRCTTRPLGEMVPNMLNRLASLLTWASAVRTLHADAITGENLTGTFIGWLSNLGVASKAALIYDSHEFEIGRSGERSRAAKWLVTHLERFLMKRCAFSIMVNDSIADEVQRIHRLKQRPVVVRNIPPLWMRDDAACAQVRREFCAALHMQEDTFLVMYHGGVMPNRGVENMLRAVALTPGVAGVVLGNGDADYVASLKKLAGELGVGERILFHPAVPVEILKDYVGAADCGLVTVPNTCMSYYLMLPNKFFENIQSETPVIGSAFPEITRLTERYQIGLLCDPDKPEKIAACIQKMRDDPVFYARCKENLKTVKRELCWENEKRMLEAAYRALL